MSQALLLRQAAAAVLHQQVGDGGVSCRHGVVGGWGTHIAESGR
jgi:hypothetical protein